MTLIDRDALRAEDDEAIRELSEIAERVCRGVARRYGVSRFADDIAQEIVVSFLRTNQVVREDEANIPVEAYLAKAAKRAATTCLHASRHMRDLKERESLDDFPAPEAGEHDLDPATFEEEERARRRRTQRRIAAGAPEAPKGSSATPGKAVEAPSDALNAAMDVLCDELGAWGEAQPDETNEPEPPGESEPTAGAEIRKARVLWGITQERMASILGIDVRAIRGYEYGSAHAVPEETAARLEQFKQKMLARDYPKDGNGFFAGKLRDWCNDLGLPEGDYLGLSKHLQLRRSTTWRWFHKPGCRPSRERIDALDVYVQAIVEWRRRQVEAVMGTAQHKPVPYTDRDGDRPGFTNGDPGHRSARRAKAGASGDESWLTKRTA